MDVLNILDCVIVILFEDFFKFVFNCLLGDYLFYNCIMDNILYVLDK